MKKRNKLLMVVFLFLIGLTSCSEEEQAQVQEIYNNTMSFGQDEYGIQLVNVSYDFQGDIALLLHSLTKNQLTQLPLGSGAKMEFEGIKQTDISMDVDYFVEIPESHYYLGVVNSSQLLRSNNVDSKKATEGYVKVVELTEDNIKLRYLYKRLDGVVFKGEYSGAYTED
ncbi:hypothetical protein [Tenacibaculum larymnensis]|uniref:Lipoprotein n=1 Tax=Tenacibaculum larymnensis TaxID=2878201 RepID=A0A9X4ENX1_9FLAO|nr:hypothetical protein [Tenacibaculum larymnensis]MDE1207448.1 hypothetical protein [Tenacibaculum larymnensis]